MIILKGMERWVGLSIGDGSRKTRLWFLSIHPKRIHSLQFLELFVAVGEAQDFLHFHRCLFQVWLSASHSVHKSVCRLTLPSSPGLQELTHASYLACGLPFPKSPSLAIIHSHMTYC